MLTKLEMYNNEQRVVGPIVSDSIEAQVKEQDYGLDATTWARTWRRVYSSIYTNIIFQTNLPMLVSLREVERAN